MPAAMETDRGCVGAGVDAHPPSRINAIDSAPVVMALRGGSDERMDCGKCFARRAVKKRPGSPTRLEKLYRVPEPRLGGPPLAPRAIEGLGSILIKVVAVDLWDSYYSGGDPDTIVNH